ncbi:MAG: glycosyltransferase WbuB [Desulfocapsaceae bacterium]|nr:glycosyltransferase WbuB [Desulfocapsaceae bacterium]
MLIAINYWPELTGIGKYTGEMAQWLVENGWDVRVITAPPYYPAWQISKEYSGWRYHSENMHGVSITRCPLWVPSRVNCLKRILHLMSFGLSSLPVILWQAWRWRPDIVFTVEPPLFCAPAALLGARLGKARSWLHVQDFEVDAAFGLGMLRSRRLQKWILGAERFLLRRFDRVSAISERMVDRLKQKKVENSRRMVFQNWVELDRIRPLHATSPLRAEWGVEDNEIVILYSGNLGEKQGLEILVDAARKLQHRSELVFLLCGDGAARSRIEQLAKGLANLRFKPLQPADRLNDLLNLADIHVLPQRADAADLVLPSKLTNMLASGRPVVATASAGTQVADLVRDCGIVVAPADSTALADALSSLAQSKNLRRALGLKARALAEQLWDKEYLLSEAFRMPAEMGTEYVDVPIGEVNTVSRLRLFSRGCKEKI